MTLEIEIEFAPNRLSEEYLATAYELALKPVSREIDKRQKPKRCKDEENIQLPLEVING